MPFAQDYHEKLQQEHKEKVEKKTQVSKEQMDKEEEEKKKDMRALLRSVGALEMEKEEEKKKKVVYLLTWSPLWNPITGPPPEKKGA